MSKPIKYGLFLFVLLGIVAALLTFVNSFTAPIIAENQLKDVLIELEKFDEDSTYKDETAKYKLPKGLSSIYLGYVNDELKTVVYLSSTVGYSSGQVNVLTAIDAKTNKIIGTTVTLADKQTAGIGDQILTHNFQTVDKDASVYAEIDVSELGKSEFNIISGATVSSKAFLTGVNLAAKHYMENFGE